MLYFHIYSSLTTNAQLLTGWITNAWFLCTGKKGAEGEAEADQMDATNDASTQEQN